jgi:hypothetical protein
MSDALAKARAIAVAADLGPWPVESVDYLYTFDPSTVRAMLDALDELEYLTRDACVEQDGPYVDGVRLDELQDARAVLDHARTLIGDNRE